jgi:hypothetical protein
MGIFRRLIAIVWPGCDRDKHVRELATLYTRWRKRPFNAAIRAEVRSMAAHRYTPKNHRIYQLLGTLNRVSMTVKLRIHFSSGGIRSRYSE